VTSIDDQSWTGHGWSNNNSTKQIKSRGWVYFPWGKQYRQEARISKELLKLKTYVFVNFMYKVGHTFFSFPKHMHMRAHTYIIFFLKFW